MSGNIWWNRFFAISLRGNFKIYYIMKIPKDLCSFDLLSWVSRTTEIENNNTELRDSLKHLCSPNIWNFNMQEFSEQELEIYKQLDLCHSDNIEIAARANDVLRKLDKDKRTKSQLASDLYLQVFDITNNNGYLLRSIEIRSIKEICDKEYFDSVRERMLRFSPNVILSCIKAFHGSYKKELQELSTLLEKIYDNYINTNSFRDARLVVDSLVYIKALNSEDANYRRALLYEQEADYNEANRDDNTFLYQTHVLYNSAYQIIGRLKKLYPEDVKRIKRKLISANLEYASVLQLAGIREKYNVADELIEVINKDCEQVPISNIYEAIGLLLAIPFVQEERVKHIMTMSHRFAPISSMAKVLQIDSKGNVIGNAEADDGLRTKEHIRFRLSIQYAIRKYLQTIIEKQIDTSYDKCLEYLFTFRPNYLTEDVVVLFAKGFSCVFDGEVIAGVHILVPALEALLRQKAEAIHGSLKKYENERNEDVLLDGILRTLEKDFDNYEEWYELKSFLTMGIDVNYRNRLMHGLMPIPDMYNQGIYLFWLCLKMYFKDSEMIGVDATKRD